MKIRKLGDKKPNVVLFQGSPRDKETCPNMYSKSHFILDYIITKWSPFIDFSVIDLSVNQNKSPIIMPCKGCVSTAGGYHCHWKCVSYDQRVHTIDGFVKIKDIKVGDVLQDGNKVLKHVKTSDSELVYELNVSDGRRIELTLDHKVKIISKETLKDEWVELKNIKAGDIIPDIVTDLAFIDNFEINNFELNSDVFTFINLNIKENAHIDNDGIHFKNENISHLRDFQLILTRVGVKSVISNIDNIYWLSIKDKDSISIINNKINVIDNLNKLNLSKKSYSVVESIKKVGYKSVYDIEVSNSHEFNCEGINIHNCSCYFKGNEKQTDLLKEFDVYDKLEKCDAFIILSPIHWHALSSQVKTLFDRLVCANLTLTVDNAKKLMGDKNIKNSEITGKFSKSGEYDDMLQNHLEGKFCAFYVHGDDGANEYTNGDFPDAYSDVIKDSFSLDPKSVVMPYVMQMKYSGVYVPDEIIQAFYTNREKDYYSANESLFDNDEFFERADTLINNLLEQLDKFNEKNKNMIIA